MNGGNRCPRCGRADVAREMDCPACLSSPAAGLPLPPRPVASFPGFEIRERLGAGGTSVVYRARQVALDRPAAVKVLAADYAASPRFLERFEREAKILASLNHPNLVHVYDFGREGGLLFLAMELVEGSTLEAWLKTRPPLSAVLAVLASACEGLDRVHKAGLVHRDVKPSNILLTADGRPKISDFGLAVEVDDALHPTLTGALLGTPHYMSPEQVLAGPVGPASDLYALGVILHLAAVGRCPFEGPAAAVLVKHAQQPAPRLSDAFPDVPRDLDDLCASLLAKDPAARPKSALAVKERLERVVDDVRRFEKFPPAPRKPKPVRPARTLSRLTLFLAGIAFLLLLLLIEGVTLAVLIVRAYAKGDLDVPPPAAVRPADPSPAAPPALPSEPGVEYEVFEGEWTLLPDFARLIPRARGFTDHFEISKRTRAQRFAMRFRSRILIPRTGEYVFSTRSDDGSKLYIGETEVVSNDGARAVEERSGRILLKEGAHPITVTYFDAHTQQVLEVYWEGPGIAKAPIPPAALIRPLAPPPAPPPGPGLSASAAEVPLSIEPGLAFEYYEGTWTSLPDFDRLILTGFGTTDTFGLSARERDDLFGYRFRGWIKLPRDGEYTFYTDADDGAALYIDNELIVMNDFSRGRVERAGRSVLKAGYHPITLTYFQYVGEKALQVLWEGPNLPKQSIPANALFRTRTVSGPSKERGAPGDWPQWRGPDRDGRSKETGLAPTWPVEGPPLVWSAKGLGKSRASLAIAEGRIFTLGEVDGGCGLLAFKASDGAPLWSRRFGSAEDRQVYSQEYHATPATDGRRVVALDGSGTLVCLNAADGAPVWGLDLQRDLGGQRIGWYADSPMIDGSRVVIKVTQQRMSAVIALNLNDGKRLWVSGSLPGSSDYAALAIAKVGDRRQYLALTQAAVNGLVPETGELLWQAVFPGKTAVASGPVYDDGILLASCGFNVGCTGYELKKQGASFSCRELYANKALASHFGDMVAVDGYVYGCDDKSLKCVRLKTGEEVWQNPCEGKGAITYADGHLLVRGLKGGVAWIKATPEGFRLDGRFVPSIRPEIRDSAWTMPVVSGGRLYLREHDVLLCYDLSKK